MSAHNVMQYISGITKPVSSEHVLVTISYKSVKEKDGTVTPAKQAKCVSVAPFSTESMRSSFDKLVPHIQGMLQTARAGILRDLNDTQENLLLVSAEDMSLDACITYMENSTESGRLTKVSIGDWFSTTLSDRLSVALADKLGISDSPSMEETNRIDLFVATYKDKISALAGSKTAYKKKDAIALIKALELGDVEGDLMASRLHKKLIAMRDAEVPDMIDML